MNRNMPLATRLASLALALALAGSGALAAEAAPKDDINNYLVDITGGAVAASSLVGVDKSIIAQIETSQDLIVALQPFAANDQKAGFGLAITPARTSLLPMAGATYVGSPVARLLGSLTFSYAQNTVEIAKQSYRKSAFSIDTAYYFRLEDDPIQIGSKAFKQCSDKDGAQNAQAIAAIVNNPSLSATAKQAALEALTTQRDEALKPCIDAKLKADAKWNADRLSISYGEGRIKAAGEDGRSLGRSLTLNLQKSAGERGVLAVSLRRTRDALDPASLGKPALVYQNSSLAAARFTYGDRAGTDFRAMAEVSNVKSSTANAFKDAFRYAVGLDRKLVEGAWLEFRLGRNRSVENGKEQTTALMNLNLSPSLFKLKQ